MQEFSFVLSFAVLYCRKFLPLNLLHWVTIALALAVRLVTLSFTSLKINYPEVISNKMKTLQIFSALILLALLELAHAGTKSKCAVVRALRNENVPDSQMRDWLCLVKHESGFRYSATNNNNDGSTDYGIFQLNDRYWCGRGSTKYSQCWRINTYGCGVNNCNDFRNSNIADDTSCAVKIKRCNSFSKWYAWIKHCRGKDLSSQSQYDFSNC